MSEVFGDMTVKSINLVYLKCLFRGLSLVNTEGGSRTGQFRRKVHDLLLKMLDGQTPTQQELDDALAAAADEALPCRVTAVQHLGAQGRNELTISFCGSTSLVISLVPPLGLGLKFVTLVRDENGADKKPYANLLLLQALAALVGCPLEETGGVGVWDAEVTTIDGLKFPLGGALAYLSTLLSGKTEPANYLKNYQWFPSPQPETP